MRIEFTYSRGPEYFRAQLRVGAMRTVRRTILAASALAAAGAVLVVASQGDGVGTAVGAAAVAVACVLPLRARRAYTEAVTVPKTWSAPRTYVITSDGLQSSSDLTSARWTWDAVRRVEVRPEAYMLWQESPTLFDLPRAPMTLSQDAELHAFLSRRGLLPTATT